jgi:hypothetical protein
MTPIPEESHVIISGILVGDGIVVRLLAESGSICRFLFYKHSNPPGLGGLVFSSLCYKQTNHGFASFFPLIAW